MNPVVGQEYRITVAHSYIRPGQRCRFLGYEKKHCQLHGEFMHKAMRFQKIKESGRESHLFDIDPKHLTEIVEFV